MTDARPLRIWPEGADLSGVKAAALKLVGGKLDYAIQPFWFSLANEDRVLVLEDGFEYGTVRDYIYPRTPEQMELAILWCLGENELDRGPHLHLDTLSRLFGGPVTEREE